MPGTSHDEGVFVVIMMLFGLLIGLILGLGFGNDYQKKKAVEAGAAEYRCDPRSGNVEFHWLPARRQVKD